MARPQFNTLKVAGLRRETDEATLVTFAVPDELQKAYQFTQGQYLTLRMTVNGEELRRPYSLCVAPARGVLQVCVKHLQGGRASGFINTSLKAGDDLDVLPPMGRFYVDCDPAMARQYVFFAGGSGITPVISNIATILDREPRARVTLFYGNRTRAGIIFREALSGLKNHYMDRLRLFHVLSDEIPAIELYAGLMDEAKVTQLVTALVDVAATDWFFICGPGPMMDAASTALENLGVGKDRIKIESFGNRPVPAAALPAKSAAGAPGQAADGAASAEVEVRFEGAARKIRVPFDGDAILDVAHREKIDAPFACKGGVCCTCRAKLIEGEVAMDIVYGLEPDEIKAGYILTCQSHPRTKKVVIDYDA